MGRPLFVRGARQVLTLLNARESTGRMPDVGVVNGGAVLIERDTILEAGPVRRVENLRRTRGAAVIEADGCVVMPAFVDAAADIFGDTPTRVSVRKYIEQVVSQGTTAIATSAAPRALRLLSQAQAPLEVFPECNEPAAVPYLAFRRRSTPPESAIIATGFRPKQNPCPSMLMAILFACTELGMTPEQAICAATVHPAWAVGAGGRLGTLEPGSQADIILLDLGDYRDIPNHVGVNLVRGVIQRGRVVYWRGGSVWLEES